MNILSLLRIIVELPRTLLHILGIRLPQIFLCNLNQFKSVFNPTSRFGTSGLSSGSRMSAIAISKSPDLWINVTELDETAKDGSGNHPIKATATFAVEREVLIKNSVVFKKMLTDRSWRELEQGAIDMQEKVDRLRVIFTVLHKTQPFLDVTFDSLWYIIEGLDYYHIEIEPFKAWCAQWRKSPNTLRNYPKQSTLFPSWRFCQIVAFANATHHLAYHAVGHIMEENSTTLKHLHLPQRVIRETLSSCQSS